MAFQNFHDTIPIHNNCGKDDNNFLQIETLPVKKKKKKKNVRPLCVSNFNVRYILEQFKPCSRISGEASPFNAKWIERTRFQPLHYQKLQWDLAPEEEGITKQI
ncbi:hypothetical protein SADUNF_Sadunf11G0053000 [Salix dunnii]|uniref:Uncharacterized protein n=1 Tax=Salix dunnii TaxID=1413687 RepID=A0A835JJU0_9ROSI|nr:hypothetical protein SADUNF_Sadunf11G0053000 [Salix dunnii]